MFTAQRIRKHRFALQNQKVGPPVGPILFPGDIPRRRGRRGVREAKVSWTFLETLGLKI